MDHPLKGHFWLVTFKFFVSLECCFPVMMNHKRRFGSGNFMHSFGLSYQECGSAWDSRATAWAVENIIERTWQDTTCRAQHFVKCPRNILITKIGRKWRIGVCLGVRTWIVHKILKYPSSMGIGLDFPSIQNRTFQSKIHENFVQKFAIFGKYHSEITKSVQNGRSRFE